MPVKIITDGQIVHRLSGKASTGSDKTVMLGYATVEPAGSVLQDDEVSDDFLELVKDGEVSGAEYYSDEEEAREAETPASPEAQQPQNDQSLNPGRGEPEQDPGQDYQDDPSFDPDQHVVVAGARLPQDGVAGGGRARPGGRGRRPEPQRHRQLQRPRLVRGLIELLTAGPGETVTIAQSEIPTGQVVGYQVMKAASGSVAIGRTTTASSSARPGQVTTWLRSSLQSRSTST
jgi:hypothetical protein